MTMTIEPKANAGVMAALFTCARTCVEALHEIERHGAPEALELLAEAEALHALDVEAASHAKGSPATLTLRPRIEAHRKRVQDEAIRLVVVGGSPMPLPWQFATVAAFAAVAPHTASDDELRAMLEAAERTLPAGAFERLESNVRKRVEALRSAAARS